jgi:O-antigen/teichoic acid export membrane protein
MEDNIILARRITKNIGVLYFGSAFSLLAGLVYNIALARYLGSIGFGKLSFALVFTQIFGVLINPGFHTFCIGEVAKNKEEAQKYLSNLITIKGILALIAFSILLLIINFLDYPDDTRIAVVIMGISMVIGSVSSAFIPIIRAFEKMEYEVAINVFSTLLQILLGLFVLFKGYGIVHLAWTYCLAASGTFVFVLALFTRKFFFLGFQMDLKFWRHLFYGAIPLGLGTIFFTLYDRIDIIMLSMMKGDTEVGIYNVAYQLLRIIHLIPGIILTALFPLMSESYQSDRELLRITAEKALRYLFVLVVPLIIGITILSDKIILFMYGKAFIYSSMALRILIWSALVSFLVQPFTFLLISSGQRAIYAFYSGIGIPINITLNLILIPNYGLMGASIATVITDFFSGTLVYLYVSRNLFRFPIAKFLNKPLLSGIAMGILIYFFHEMTLFLVVPMAVIIYFFIFYSIKGVPAHDLDLVRNIFISFIPKNQ